MVAKVGLVLMSVGIGLFGYLAWALFGTGVQTAAGQQVLHDQWVDRDRIQPAAVERRDRLESGVALMQLPEEVHDGALMVVDGVGERALRKGPGRYPQSEDLGAPGNFAVAGHRTTYGAPFGELNLLERGDRIVVTDVSGVRWEYRVVEKRVVDPSHIEVVDDDPLGSGEPTLTLTTCNPRYSDRERLVVHAVLDQS